MAKRQRVDIGGRVFDVTNLDKLMWPDVGVTKAHLIRYFVTIAPRLLPHVSDRPLSLTRYPNGVEQKGFYQKNCPRDAPDWIDTYTVHSEGGDRMTRYVVANESAVLAWLANQGVVELHPWMSTTERIDRPDYAVIDIDPSKHTPFDDVIAVARLIKEMLSAWGLVGIPKLSGASGVHIYVPLEPKYSYEQSSRFVGLIGSIATKVMPDKATNERLVKNRGRRVYIDHLQNLPGKTIVAPYSPRPLPGAPISVPFSWDELDWIHPSRFSLSESERVLERPDFFADLYCRRQNIDRVLSSFQHFGRGTQLMPR